ncbi:MAG: EI24 domain-containing protein [Myxococcales bacterium]
MANPAGLSPRYAPSDLFRGLGYAFKGVALLRKYPDLVRYWSVPIVLTALSLLASFLLALRYHDDLLALLWRAPQGHDWLATLARGLYWLADAVAFLLSLSVLVLACVMLSMLVAAPFNDALSEAIEERELQRRSPAFSLSRLARDVARTLRIELFKLTLFATIMMPLTIFSWLVPGVGHVVVAVVGGLFTASYFAIDYTDWPASRRGIELRARLSLFSKRPWLMVGFGLAVWGCLFVPILNLAFMPIAVAGGTRLFLDLEAELHS